jgi:hypothetical protein
MSSAIACIWSAAAAGCGAVIAGAERGAATSPAATVKAITQLNIRLGFMPPCLTSPELTQIGNPSRFRQLFPQLRLRRYGQPKTRRLFCPTSQARPAKI